MARRSNRGRDLRVRHAVLGFIAIALVAAIGVISYRADKGLPWQSSYDVSIELPNAMRLAEGNDVRIGGSRVGRVAGVDAMPAKEGRGPYARVDLDLDSSVDELPADTSIKVRPASVLGATFVELTLGASRSTVADGGTLPLRQTKNGVELTDLLDIFDRSTGRNFQKAMGDLSGGFAGRGVAVNSMILGFADFLPPLTNVSRVLASPQTHLGDFFRGYEATVAALEPVSADLAGFVAASATTFGALARERTAFGGMLEAAPPAELASTRALTAVRPGLDGLARLTRDLRPAGVMLPAAVAQANATLSSGTTAMRPFPRFSSRLDDALVAVDDLSRYPATTDGLRKLNDLSTAGTKGISKLLPAQIHCNVISLFMQGWATTFGRLGIGEGPSLASLFLGIDPGAIGEPVQNARPAINLHTNPIPNETAQECEAGNEPWTQGKQALGNPPGLQANKTRDTAPPPGVQERAREAGLLTDPEGVK